MSELTGNYVVDSYAWVEYLNKNEGYRKHVEEGILKTPTIAIAEICRYLIRKSISKSIRDGFLKFVLDRSAVIELDPAHAIRGGEIAEEEKIPLIDALIYSYASNEENLLTGDEHFKGKKNVVFVK